MKRDRRASRDYDLNENRGAYVSRDRLIFWYRFDDETKYPKNNTLIPNKARSSYGGKSTEIIGVPIAGTPRGWDATAISGSLQVGTQGDGISLTSSRLPDESWMRGRNYARKDVLAVGDAQRFQTYLENIIQTWDAVGSASAPAALKRVAQGFTVSMWCRFLDNWPVPIPFGPLPHQDVQLFAYDNAVRTPVLRFWYDVDGGVKGHTGEPGFHLSLADNLGATLRVDTWNCGAAGVIRYPELRGWMHIVLAVENFNDAGVDDVAAWSGRKLYINGKDLGVPDGHFTPGGTDFPLVAQKVTRVYAGNSDLAGGGGNIALGEFAWWDTALTHAEVGELYDRAKTSFNSGFVSNPPRTSPEIQCGGDAYPTIAKSTDQRRLNASTPFFDDQALMIDYGPVLSGSQFNYPTLLRSGSRYIDSVVSTPNTVPDIYVANSQAKTTAIFGAGPLVGETLTLTSSDGTGRTYTAAVVENFPTNHFVSSSHPMNGLNLTMISLKRCIEDSAGHDGKITCTVDPPKFHMFQTTPGLKGNTTITHDFSDATISPYTWWSAFQGGTGATGSLGSQTSRVVGDYLPDTKSFSSPYAAFDDSRIPVNVSEEKTYISDFAPGFTKDKGDRIMIEIDITPSAPTTLQIVSGVDGQVGWNEESGTQPIDSQETGPKTGLSYFNFKTKIWEPMCHRLPQHDESGQPVEGVKLEWSLPQEKSSSLYSGYWHQNSKQVPSPVITNLRTVPRLFQPFTSLFAHRSTFNWLHDGFHSFQFIPGTGYTAPSVGGAIYGSSPGSWDLGLFPNYYPADISFADNKCIEELAVFKNVYRVSSGGVRDGSSLAPNCLHTAWQKDVFNYLSSDLLGLHHDATDVTVTDICNDSTASWGTSSYWGSSDYYDEILNDELKKVGLPIAYSNYSNNAAFYATASQLIRMGDYIQHPFLLESVEVETDVDTYRLFKTATQVTGAFGRGHWANGTHRDRNADDTTQEVSAWSVTNNFVDCLTFFLCRQNDHKKGLAQSAVQANEATRELITFSNNMFFSPYIGWDFWQSWAHPYYDGGADGMWPGEWHKPLTSPDGMPYNDLPSSFFPWSDGRYAGGRMAADDPSRDRDGAGNVGFRPDKLGVSAFYPMCGRRATRRWIVRSSSLLEHVPGCDGTAPYRTAPGLPLRVDGLGGVFWSAAQPTALLLGVPATGSIGDTRLSLAHTDGQKLGLRYMTASLHVHKPFPVRVCGPYAQHDVPIMPLDATGPMFAHPLPNINPFNNYIYSGTLDAGGAGGVYPASGAQAVTTAGFQWSTVGMVGTAYLGPRTALPSMGRYWPGGMQLDAMCPDPNDPSGPSHTPESTFQDLFTQPKMVYNSDMNAGLVFIYSDPTVVESGAVVYPTKEISDSTYLGSSLFHTATPLRIFSDTPATGSTVGYPNLANGTWGSGPYAYPQGLRNVLGRGSNVGSPNWSKFKTSGSHVYESAVIFQPDDQILLGAQWSPGDPVHTSYRSLARLINCYSASCHMSAAAMAPTLQWGNWSAGYNTYGGVLPVTGWNYQAGSQPIQQQYRFLGWDSTNDLTVHASASCTIRATPSKLRLYGVLLKDQKQYHHPLSQQTRTVCVHEAISNGPVIDEYDLATNHDLYYSPFSTLISGSTRLDGITAVQSSSPMTSSARGIKRRYSPLGGRLPSNLYDAGSIRRTIRCSDMSEYYYDSLAPNIRGLWQADGRELSNVTQGTDLTAMGFSGGPHKPVLPISCSAYFSIRLGIEPPYWGGPEIGENHIFRNDRWERAFPFESRYNGVDRAFVQQVNPIVVVGEDMNKEVRYTLGDTGTGVAGVAWKRHAAFGVNEPHDWGTPLICRIQYDINENKGASTWPRYIGSDLGLAASANQAALLEIIFKWAGAWPSPGNKQSMEMMFGIGDRNDGGTPTLRGICTYNPKYTSFVALFKKIRGLKYGLIAAQPLHTSAVYRRDRFGQFRDMLEQRQYSTMFINDPGDVARRRKRQGKRRRLHQEPQRSPIEAIFRVPTWTNPTSTDFIVSPPTTQCSNLSAYATSSLPYFDGTARNRDAVEADAARSIVLTWP